MTDALLKSKNTAILISSKAVMAKYHPRHKCDFTNSKVLPLGKHGSLAGKERGSYRLTA